jgi:hypothetical protein
MKFTLLALGLWFAFASGAAQAKGTVLIQQSNGHTNVYDDAVIKVIHGALYVTSADGEGTLVINRAACSHQGEILTCFATTATLVQSGETKALDLKKGTIYVNSTDAPQPLVLSTTKLAPHSIMLSLETDRGTYIGLTGGIDKMVQP